MSSGRPDGEQQQQAQQTAQQSQQPPVKKQQKEMTKAERRAVQEAQRAAKAAAKGGNNQQQQKGKSKEQQQSLHTSSSSPQQQLQQLQQQSQQSQQNQNQQQQSQQNQQQQQQQQFNENSLTSNTGGNAGGDSSTSNLSSTSLALFGHLDPPRSARSLFPIKGYVHPGVLALAIQFTDMKIVGANARCIAMLEAFKDAIKVYTVPPGTSLSRHLPTHLSPQINHLVKARPMATSMGNAIRYLKWEIAQVPVDMPDEEAKSLLCERIDHFIRDRITLAGKVIEDHAMSKIKDGDVVLTYARSSLVEGVLIEAKRRGKDFSVVIVDSKPMLEGKKLLERLVSEGVPTTYVLIGSIGSVLPDISIVILGTHSVLSNGSLYARSGTAMVSMMAKAQGIPVVCCCETYKFSDRIMLDSIVDNEMGSTASLTSISQSNNSNEWDSIKEALNDIQSSNVTPLSLLYDVTRPEDVTCVICEVAIIPVQSVPVAMRDYKPISST